MVEADLADIAATLGRRQAALAHYAAALDRLLALGARWNVAASLERMASVFAALSKPKTAARLFGAAASLRAAIGTPPLPVDGPVLERLQTELVQALGETEFAETFAAGHALTPAAAVAEATAMARPFSPGQLPKPSAQGNR